MRNVLLEMMLFVVGALLAVDCVFAADSVPSSSVTLALPTADEVTASVLNDGNPFRLESVFGKAARGERIVLSALGGSITAGAGAGGTNGRWSDLVADWFARTFPAAKVVRTNSGIGATGSRLGAHRIFRDIAPLNADFVTVDFSVNDCADVGGGETMEGCVRQLLRLDSHPALLLVGFFTETGATVQDEHLAVARHYALPFVSVKNALWPRISSARLQWKGCSSDSVHPKPQGHAYAAALVTAYLERRYAAWRTGSRGTESPFPSRPVFTDAYDHGTLTLPSALKIVENVGFGKGRDRECWHDVLAGFRPGDRLSFSTDATTLTLLFWQQRADFGRVRVSVDGKVEVVLDGWFEAVWGGRARPVEIFRNRPGRHVVDIEIIGERAPESKGHRFELCAVLEQREDAYASTITVEKPYFRWLFGGFGFQHSEASLTAMMSDEFRDERALKSFAEISPSFGRVYVGFAETSKEQMDRFADYYDRTFRVADTTLYAVPCAIQSFPERLDPKEYAEKVATNLDYLVKVRDCRKIRYYCLTNEQVAGGKWDYFRSNNQMDCYKRLNEELFFAFRRHGLDILILATDIAVTSYPETEAPKSLKWAADEMNDYIGAFCSHWYVYGQKTGNLSLWKGYNDYFAELVKIALGRQKRYILGEWGFHQVYGKPGVMIDDVKPYWRCPSNRTETVLAKMEVGLAAMNQGAYACVNWSFCDYPDPWPFEDGHSPEAHARYEDAKCVWTPDLKYNKCGMFSWGTTDRDYSSCEEYYAMGYLAKLFRKGATVLPVKSDDPLLRSGAVLNPDQSVSVAVINRGEARQVTVDCSSFKVRHDGTPLLHQPLRRYVYEAGNVPWSAFNDLQPASGTVKSSDGSFTALLPAKSMTFFTTDYVDRIPSAVEGVALRNDILSWTPSADAEHRYYRVYRDGRQIASTVATSCRVGRQDGKFSVVSVDRWGNSGIVQQERNVTNCVF